jgi:hypothetical protein
MMLKLYKAIFLMAILLISFNCRAQTLQFGVIAHSHTSKLLKELHSTEVKAIQNALHKKVKLHFFYDYSEAQMLGSMMKTYFDKKILGYKYQDTSAKRNISKDYVNVQWFLDSFNKCCSNCSCSFDISFTDGIAKSNITADRIRCDEDHNLENIVPMCCYCNCSKSNK